MLEIKYSLKVKCALDPRLKFTFRSATQIHISV